MNKLSPEKKKHIGIVIGITLAVLIVLYLFVIGTQQSALDEQESKIQEMQGKVADADKKIAMAKGSLPDYQDNQVKLGAMESSMAPVSKNDWKVWLRMQLFNVQTNRHHDIVLQEISLDPNNEVGAKVLPKFDYTAASFRVPILAHYADLGKFIADVENRYPYLRVENMTIQPYVTAGMVASDDKLIATLYMIVLIQSGTTTQ